ncbi:MAG: hypothetical protein JSS14_23435 [Proteobacteria bacterium]|nr:hypothetical protein [Pseudomonadota bacterium]
MVAAIDLNELAQARAAVARLVDLGRALLARDPQARGRHQPTQCLHANLEPVQFIQLLSCQRRTKVSVALVHDRQSPICHTNSQLVVAGPAAFA